jgi:hypothetical protein
VLLVQRLGDGADPGVAEPHADNRLADGVGCVYHNVENTGIETSISETTYETPQPGQTMSMSDHLAVS